MDVHIVVQQQRDEIRIKSRATIEGIEIRTALSGQNPQLPSALFFFWRGREGPPRDSSTELPQVSFFFSFFLEGGAS